MCTDCCVHLLQITASVCAGLATATVQGPHLLQSTMAPFPDKATCVLPMSATEYYSIQNLPAFRSLMAQVCLHNNAAMYMLYSLELYVRAPS
jgi:hypothetical protein